MLSAEHSSNAIVEGDPPVYIVFDDDEDGSEGAEASRDQPPLVSVAESVASVLSDIVKG
jgi:hypothetical protein